MIQRGAEVYKCGLETLNGVSIIPLHVQDVKDHERIKNNKYYLKYRFFWQSFFNLSFNHGAKPLIIVSNG